MSGALSGIKVLDLSRVLAGPFCTMILGDLGAEVIKVEAPGGSDDTRAWGPPFQGDFSAYYLCANRNKRAITLNLKTEQGQEILKKLIKQSDVLIHNFKYGTMERLGFDYEQVKQLNPRIVYCSITGFGSQGPYRKLPGYDYIIQAMSGLMSITGSEESGPLKVGVAITDVFTGLYAAIGIEAALYERERSGEGQFIDMALFDSAVSSLVNVASNYLVSGVIPKRLGNYHPNIVPYQTFKTADGEMVVAVGNDRQFANFCTALGLENLIEDNRFATNEQRVAHRAQLEEIIQNVMKTQPSKVWLDKLVEYGIPCGPIHNMQEVFADEQIAAREMKVSMEHPTAGTLQLVGSPLKFSRTKVSYRRYPPLAGEHTLEVLQELGFSEDQYEQLKNEGIV